MRVEGAGLVAIIAGEVGFAHAGDHLVDPELGAIEPRSRAADTQRIGQAG